MMIHYMHITFPPKTLGPGHTPDAAGGMGSFFPYAIGGEHLEKGTLHERTLPLHHGPGNGRSVE